MRTISVAVTQMACSWNRENNIRIATVLVEEAVANGAQIVLLQELFETPYFCIKKDKSYFKEATTIETNPAIKAMRKLAHKHNIIVPVSFYELADNRRYNSLAMIDAGGELLGVYRKSHIPDFPRYEEAYYFAPGDTGFIIWDTKHAKIGAGVCWDQWFPEAARIMVLKGAEVLLYPTAIGRPVDGLKHEAANSKPHWQLTMQGHAAANMVVLAAANRVGVESGGDFRTQFYGSSFIANQLGAKVVELGEETPGVAAHTFDLDEMAAFRRQWGIFRTRRTDLYAPLCTLRAPDYLMDASRQ
jgi:N-carbamoylputrescine amidase